MSADKKDVIEGIKTFFVVPDLSIMPEDFLPHFFLKGFETYYLLEDQHLDIPAKIRILLSLFPDLILFFNTDRRLGDLEWPTLVKNLKDEFGDRARMGVLYGRHIGDETRRQMERTYLYDIGINCGCIPMGYGKATNQALLTGVLTANQANGRRKYLRALCGETCQLNFMKDNAKLEGRILDVSVSHFSCEFYGRDPGLQMFEKASDIQLKLGGIICTVDAVLFTKRVAGNSVVHVFVFRNSRGKDGLDYEMLTKVNGFIRERFERGVKSMVHKAFEEAIALKRAAKVRTKT